jgi:hypothetical protein
MAYRQFTPGYVAGVWDEWCGPTAWSHEMRKLEGRATITWYGGYPRSKSAIPLCFTITLNDGAVINGSRLRDIREANAR